MIEKDDIFEANDKLYVVLDQVDFEGNNYCMCNEMVNENTFGSTYVVFQNFEDGIVKVEDDNLLNRMAPLFGEHINNEAYEDVLNGEE